VQGGSTFVSSSGEQLFGVREKPWEEGARMLTRGVWMCVDLCGETHTKRERERKHETEGQPR
jgi:hypothetical protein